MGKRLIRRIEDDRRKYNPCCCCGKDIYNKHNNSIYCHECAEYISHLKVKMRRTKRLDKHTVKVVFSRIMGLDCRNNSINADDVLHLMEDILKKFSD